MLPPVPSGLQRLIELAASDDSFRAELLARRSALAVPAAVSLTPSERRILDVLPAEQLAATIDGHAPGLAGRRAFLQGMALGALAMLATGSCKSCESEPETQPPPPAQPPAGPERPRKAIRNFGHDGQNQE